MHRIEATAGSSDNHTAGAPDGCHAVTADLNPALDLADYWRIGACDDRRLKRHAGRYGEPTETGPLLGETPSAGASGPSDQVWLVWSNSSE